ncbi:unnamed protein product [Aureobasidium pullulans]|nr:unnamed protein product [Aureobasidium pullulans]
MESLRSEQQKLDKKGNLSKTIGDVQKTIDLLTAAREAVAAGVKRPLKASLDQVNSDIKEIYSAHKDYSKALDKVCEGAVCLARQLESRPKPARHDQDEDSLMQDGDNIEPSHTDFKIPGDMQSQFAHMYTVLDALRRHHNLDPAIQWARQHSHRLDQRGSNLEFDLCRLRFVELYCQDNDPNDYMSGPLKALEYARQTFPNFSARYMRETSSLLGSLAFAPALTSSPYKSKLERVMGEVGGQWTSVNELPVEIPLPQSYLFHSIFVCPVSKEQGTDANPPMMLPCGHVIAKESLEKISRGNK